MQQIKTQVPLLASRCWQHGQHLTLLLLILLCSPGSTLRAQGNQDAAKGFMIESRPSGATVTIEGEIIGKTPCSFPYQLSGRYRLYAEKRGYETVSRDIDFGARKIETITFMLTPKTRKMAVARSLVFPGWGQDYTEQKTKSRILQVLEGGAMLSLAYAHNQFTQRQDEYNARVADYRSASRQLALEPEAWLAVRRAHDRYQQAETWRRAALFSLAGLHAFNFLDALFVFPKKLRQIEFLADPGTSGPASDGSGFTISYTLPF